MKKIKLFSLLSVILLTLTLQSCTENYSTCERIGTVTKFSTSGLVWKSHEGHLNITQTGMNSSTGFDFSIDNDNESTDIINTLDSAATLGWKVKINSHQVLGWNWCGNRGETDHFVTSVIVLDKTFDNPFGLKNTETTESKGHVIDTIYIVITPNDPNYNKFFKK